MSSDATDIGRSGLIVLIGTGISMISFYLFRVVLARYLDQDYFGAIILMLSFLDIAVIGCLLGLNQGLVKYLPDTDDKGSEQNTYITISIIFVTVSSILVTFIGFLFIEQIQEIVFSDTVSLTFVTLILISLPFYSMIKLSSGVLRGYQDSVSFTIISKISLSGGRLIAAISALLLIGSGLAAVAGIVFAYILIAIFSIGLIFLKGWRPVLDNSIRVRPFFSFSIPLLFSSSLYILLTQSDKLMIGYFTSATAAVGQYEVAITIASLLIIFHQSFSFLLFPRISELVSEGKESEVASLYNQSTKWILIFTVPLLSIVMLRPSFFINLFGEEYSVEGLYRPIIILAFAKFIDSLLGPNGQALLGFGRSRTVLIYNTVAVATNISLNIILIPAYGITGAAISALIGYLTMNFLKTGDLYFNHQFDLFDKGSVFYSVSALSLAISVSYFLPESNGMVLGFIFAVTVGFSSLIGGIIVLYLLDEISEEDKEIVGTIFDTLSKG